MARADGIAAISALSGDEGDAIFNRDRAATVIFATADASRVSGSRRVDNTTLDGDIAAVCADGTADAGGVVARRGDDFALDNDVAAWNAVSCAYACGVVVARYLEPRVSSS